jgi:hypothetical protein
VTARPVRTVRRAPTAALVLLMAAVATGCGDPEPQLGPLVPVAVYARVGPPTVAWVGVTPLTNPPLEVGFNGADVGVACWTAPIGSQVVLLDGNPGQGRTNVIAVVGTLATGPLVPARSMWLDIGKDGSVMSGSGVPAWWSGGGGC